MKDNYPHFPVNKEEAEFDAHILLNGGPTHDWDGTLEDMDPVIVEGQPDKDDDREDAPVDLDICVGGDCRVATCWPVDSETPWDIANAIKRAGVHIVGLLQENDALLSAQGKDVAAQRVALLQALKELRDWCVQVNWHLCQVLDREETPQSEVVQKASAVIRACEGKHDGPH